MHTEQSHVFLPLAVRPNDPLRPDSGRGTVAPLPAVVSVLMGSLLAACLGCDRSSLPLAPVSGTVTHQDQPLGHGMVVFFPEEGTPGPQAVGTIQPDGTFRMQTLQRNGAAIGWHAVLVHCQRTAEPSGDAPANLPHTLVGESLIPSKYSMLAESPLRFEVTEGRNEYAIVLE